MSFADDRAAVLALVGARRFDDAHALMRELHRRYHDRPLDHVRVHRLWMRVHATGARGTRVVAYAHVLGHAFAGHVVAAPASLLQRYTGLAVPAFREDRK